MKRIKMMCFLLALLGLLSACSAHSVDAEEQSAPTWQSRYDLGVRYLSDGRYEEAILAFTAAIEIDPKNAQAYEQRGDAYWELAQSAQGSEQTDAYRSAAEDYESAMQWGARRTSCTAARRMRTTVRRTMKRRSPIMKSCSKRTRMCLRV